MQTALIILAAVVVLIVIVVVLGMRYLRADDDEEFDEVQTRSGREVPSRDRRRLSDHDQPLARVGHSRGGQYGGADRGYERRQRGDRSGDERGWSLVDARRHQSAGARPVRDGRSRGRADAEFATAAGRPSRAGEAGGPRGRRDRDDSRDRDDLPTASFDSRQEYQRASSAARDERDGRNTTRPNARPDGRSTSRGQGKREPLPAVRPRPGRGKRDDDGEWPSTEWDELSDVDYWAELASDRPVSPDRPEPRRAAEPGRDRPGASSLPVRSTRRPEPDVAAGRGADRSDEFTGVAARRPNPPASEPITALLTGSRPADDIGFRPTADDDPLTSPSFPRIAADDSRSYRRSRAEGPGSQDHGLTPPGGYPRPADPYRSVPSSSSAPQGYPIPLASPTPAPSAAAPAGSGSYPAYAYPDASYQGATVPYPMPATSPDYQGYPYVRPGEVPYNPASYQSQVSQPASHPGYTSALPAPAGQPGTTQGAGPGTVGAGPGQVPTAAGQATQYYSVPSHYSVPGHTSPAYPNEESGYLPAGQAPGGYPNSDPYAADPYGYPGYRTGGY